MKFKNWHVRIVVGARGSGRLKSLTTAVFYASGAMDSTRVRYSVMFWFANKNSRPRIMAGCRNTEPLASLSMLINGFEVDIVLFHFLVQSGAVDSKSFCSSLSIPAIGFQRLND